MKNYKTILGAICIIAIIMFSFIKQDETVEIKAMKYMQYLSEHEIKGGCFYVQGDSITSFKNYRK